MNLDKNNPRGIMRCVSVEDVQDASKFICAYVSVGKIIIELINLGLFFILDFQEASSQLGKNKNNYPITRSFFHK